MFVCYLLSVSECCQDTTYNLFWHFRVYWPKPRPSPRWSPRPSPRPRPSPSPSPSPSLRPSPIPSPRPWPRPSLRRSPKPSPRLIFLSAYTLSAQHTELDTDDRQSCLNHVLPITFFSRMNAVPIMLLLLVSSVFFKDESVCSLMKLFFQWILQNCI